MHTIAHIAFYVASTIASILLLIAVAIGAYSHLALAIADDVVIHTGHGSTFLNKDEVEVNMEFPILIAVVGLVWALIAFGLHFVK